MIRKTTRIALEVVIGTIAVGALVAGLAVWRLAAGPVDLDFLTPEIEAALSDAEEGIQVRIGSTQLAWEGGKRTVDLHVRQVRVRDRDDILLAALPDVVLRLSLRALVQGVVAPTRVEVFGASISALRRADGSFRFGPWDEGPEGPGGAVAQDAPGPPAAGAKDDDFSRLVPDLLAQLLKRPTVEDPLSFLQVLRIAGGRVTVNDRRLGLVWNAPFADIELRRDEDGLAGEMILKIDLRGRQMNLYALLDYGRASNQVDVVARFSDLAPPVIVSLAPGLTAVGGLDMLFAGSVSASIGVDGVVRALDFDIRGGEGAFTAAGLFDRPLPVRGLRAAGRVSSLERRMDLDEATVELGTAEEPGPEITLAGNIASVGEGFRGDLEIEAEASVAGVPMAKLARYWPAALAPNPRAWILENISKGTAERATARVAFRAPDGDFEAAEVRHVDGTMRYAGLDVHFLRPMPPVTGLAGDATFDHDRIVFRAGGGRLGALETETGTIEIVGLSLGREIMTIDLPVVGPLRDAMRLLDHDRLKLIRKLGLDPANVGGLMAARVGFKFPLIKDLTIDDIDVAAAANLEDVALRNLLLGLDAGDGRLNLSLDKAGMRLAGPLRFGGVPMEVDWTEVFTSEAAERTRVEVKAARIDAADRARFGIPLEPYLTGPVSAHVIARRDQQRHAIVEAAVNLQDAKLDAAPLPWTKPAGVPAKATFALNLVGDRLTRLSDFELSAGAIGAKGAAVFDVTGKSLSKVDLRELVVNGSRLTNVAVDFATDGIGVRIGGGILDATPWLEEAEAPRVERPPAETPPAAPPEAPPTPLRLSAARLDALLFAPERYLERVSVDLVRTRRGWERIAFSGTVPRTLWQSPKGGSGADVSGTAPKTLRFDFGPDPAGGMRLLATAEDMGAVLRALGALDTVNGGRLEITGQSDGPLPFAPLTGRVEARDYVLVGAPGMAKLLTVASLTGINDLLRGEGIRFQRLSGDYTLADGVMHTELMRAYGPALGLTAKGEVDFERAETNLQGTIVPAYTVNRILGGIPLLGPLLTGGEGEGVFAVTYRIAGPLGDPKVNINPLSAIAPGFLRTLFSAGGSGDSADGEPTLFPRREDP